VLAQMQLRFFFFCPGGMIFFKLQKEKTTMQKNSNAIDDKLIKSQAEYYSMSVIQFEKYMGGMAEVQELIECEEREPDFSH
jgi:hypothetical protein